MGLKKIIWIISVFIFLQMLAVTKNVYTKDFSSFFWFCDFAPLLFAVGFLLKKYQFVKSLINIGLIPQFMYTILLFLALFFGIDSISFYSILARSKIYILVSFLLHLFSSNLALFLTYRIRPKKISLIYSFAILAAMFVLILIFTVPGSNINYVYSSNFLGFEIPYYTYLWIILTMIFVILPTYFIQYWIYKKSQSG